jgi:hypothetical protein
LKSIGNLGVAVAVASALAIGLLTACATPPQQAPSPRLAALPPSLRLAPPPADRGLAAQASAFESFMRHARGIDAGFSGPGDVAQALQTGAGHEPKELEAGMIAYAAMAALQEPRFVAAVRADRDRGELARRLAGDPGSALAIPGGEAAGARASGALYAQGQALFADGERVKHASYSVQHQAWSKAKVPDAAGRLSRVKHISQAGYQPRREDAAELQTALAQGGRRGGATSPVVSRGVALAALSVLGEDGRAHALMSEPRTGMCLRLAKLNLYQCLASAGPHYEDIYCLGQHAMIDPGQCVVEATRGPGPRQVAVTKASYRR